MLGQSSLLRKLLDQDIRRERSHLLQAFRFFENAGCALHTFGEPRMPISPQLRLLQDAAAKTS